MKLSKVEQSLLSQGVKLTVLASSKLSDGTEIKVTISKTFKTRTLSDNWYFPKRELIRTALLSLENACCKRVVNHIRATPLRRKLFADS